MHPLEALGGVNENEIRFGVLESKDSANDAVMFSSLVVSNRRSYFLAFAYDAAYDSTIFFTFSRRCLDKNASTLSLSLIHI